ncbi:MAG: hypothetical protein K8823_1104 [Cenarchaeum symbiont of Oopsacas minuta]|nr:hypothetical protein [Cenarchaeum symbiont of Oopsacas minuta]
MDLISSAGQGQIIEYSRDDVGYFCLTEFEEGVRLLCRMLGTGTPKCGDMVTLEECGRDSDGYFFNIRL